MLNLIWGISSDTYWWQFKRRVLEPASEDVRLRLLPVSMLIKIQAAKK
jgi:hypothetical protein